MDRTTADRFEVSTFVILTPSNNTILGTVWRERCGLYNVWLTNTDMNTTKTFQPSFLSVAKAEEYAREWVAENWNV